MTRAAAALALACALAPAAALADPLVLRAPVPSRVAAVALGVPESSAGVWLGRRFGVALEWRLPVSAAGASAGTRWTLVGDALGWGIDLHVAAGVVVPLIEPAVAVSATPSLAGRWRDDTFAVAVSLTSPMVLRFVPDPTLRVPLLFEGWFGVHLRRLWLMAQGSVGSTWVSGLSAWSGAFQGTLYAAWEL